MNRKKATTHSSKTAGATQAAWTLGVIVLAATGGTYAYRLHKASLAAAASASTSGQPQAEVGLWATYKNAWDSAQVKAQEIKDAIEDNEKLRNENANLRLKLETVQFEHELKEAALSSAEDGKKLKKGEGSRVARTLANINYKAPENLLPAQLYTLGMTYFKAHEDEKAAVIFSLLTGLEDNAAYRTAKMFTVTGVAWYRLGNRELADHYFDLTLQQPDESLNLRYQAQARLWRGLIAQESGKKTEAQYWMKDLLDHHPHSEEASWVNGVHGEFRVENTAERAPAENVEKTEFHKADVTEKSKESDHAEPSEK